MTKKQYGEEAERLAPSLRRIAYSIVHNEQDAQDAVQQALLSVWAHRKRGMCAAQALSDAHGHQCLQGYPAHAAENDSYGGDAGGE